MRFLEATDARENDVKSQRWSLQITGDTLNVSVGTGEEALNGGMGGGWARVSLCLSGEENKQNPY